jgi:hypothetical protein
MNPHPDLTLPVINGLGWIYLLLTLMNGWWTYRVFKNDGHYDSVLGISHVPKAYTWALYTSALLLIAIAHLVTNSSPDRFLLKLPDWFKTIVNFFTSDARIFFSLSVVLFWAMIQFRETLVKATPAWLMLNGAILFLALSLTDYDFRQIVGKPDNVPIVGLLFLFGYFTWLYFQKAVDNDRRIAEGRPLAEKELKEQVLVWPDLVYTELLCMLLLTAFLILWGVALPAPLEEPGSSVKTPNPSKAPWYFLGLQEMLVYYDPWMAGVVLPLVIIGGLMAIPYIDFNRKGNGYYCFNDRKVSVAIFLFGFLPLWIGMIILGTFIRGPNWNMFGAYEYWDVHKLEVLNNINLSDFVWVKMLGQSLPAYQGPDTMLSIFTILKREWLGLALTVGYLVLLPPLMAMTFLRTYFMRMGFIRYMVFANLILFMMALPLKMVLRWAFSLKYIVAIPEWFFNI